MGKEIQHSNGVKILYNALTAIGNDTGDFLSEEMDIEIGELMQGIHHAACNALTAYDKMDIEISELMQGIHHAACNALTAYDNSRPLFGKGKTMSDRETLVAPCRICTRAEVGYETCYHGKPGHECPAFQFQYDQPPEEYRQPVKDETDFITKARAKHYKVWVQVEEVCDAEDHYKNVTEPYCLGRFDSQGDAEDLLDALQSLTDAGVALTMRQR